MSENIIYGNIQAGFDTPSDEQSRHSLNIQEYLIEHPTTSVILKVNGESMIDAGIYPGDFIVVEKGVPPKLHDVVAAKIDGQYTLKFYEKDIAGKIYLAPANQSLQNTYPESELEIFGVVRSLMRKY